MKYSVTHRILHWLTALLFIPMLAGGYFWLRPMASDDPQKLDALMYHMAFGVFLVALTGVRLILRWRRSHPETSGLALWAHRGFYALLFLMPVSGFTMVFSAGLNDIVFARNGAPLPADLSQIPGHWYHGLTALALLAFIAVHLVGAFKDAETIHKMT